MSEPRILTIDHGRCEDILVGWVRVRLNMGIEYYSKNKGREAIRIENLPSLFGSRWLSSEPELHRKYPDLEYSVKERPMMPKLKIFPIMDTERDLAHSDRSYMTGNMFAKSCFSDRVVPIYNIPDLDTIFREAGIGKVTSDKPSSYSDILDGYDVIEIYEMVKGREDTNLSEFLKYCLKTRPEYQGREF